MSPGDGVNIDATLSWPIVHYGPRSRCDITLLETGGTATLSSTVHIHLEVKLLTVLSNKASRWGQPGC
ncbi:MAG: hypothetical protein ACMX3H_08035 [Sodalis sp. (in: enterobacteria)]|uniref:hypothetical protein n=1 Tax=Sodalis sp. (in: enterobacteria) TaxID=1898979 RepID=UPI0039E485DE